MREHGGFEGNAQTFRIVTKLEPYTEHFGMNLARRTLLGLIKYPALISKTCADVIPDSVSHQRKLKAKEWAPKVYMTVTSHSLIGYLNRSVSQISNFSARCAMSN